MGRGGGHVRRRYRHLLVAIPLVFFFQAEDGIRDLTVTGVQTCALPISPGSSPVASISKTQKIFPSPCAVISMPAIRRRSEERRVGKESRDWNELSIQEPSTHEFATLRTPAQSEARRAGKECSTNASLNK